MFHLQFCADNEYEAMTLEDVVRHSSKSREEAVVFNYAASVCTVFCPCDPLHLCDCKGVEP